MEFYVHQEQKRDHFGTVAIDVHRVFPHGSTAPIPRASGLGRTSFGLPHTQGVHRNLRTNPVDPNSPLHSYQIFVLCILNSTDVWFVPLNAGYTVSVRRTRLDALVLSTLAFAGESPTCILHEGVYTPCNTRDQCITRSLQR